MPYPKPHPPAPAPVGTAVKDLKNASVDHLELHYHKGLQHDNAGRAVPAAFETLRAALDKHTPDLFRSIQLHDPTDGRKLINTQSGLAADRETGEGWYFRIPNAPERAGQKDATAAEMIEVYWMALLRDLPFDQFGSNADVAAAADELKDLKLYPDPATANDPRFQPRSVTPDNIFRGGDWTPSGQNSPEHAGPYISQFLLLPIGYGVLAFDQRERRRAAEDYPAAGPHLISFQN
jgi:hypothetical protein